MPPPHRHPLYNMPAARVTWLAPHASRRGSLGSGLEQKARMALNLRRDACDAMRCKRPPRESRTKRGA